MRTVTDNLHQTANRIKEVVEDLLLNHSTLYRWNEPDSIVFSVDGDYRWQVLDDTGLQIQSRALEEYRRFFAILKVLLREQPRDTLSRLQEADSVIIRVIEQRHTRASQPKEALDSFIAALDKQLRLLTRLYDRSAGDAIYVPDTNAILYHPAVDNWRFADVPRFTLILTPTVLSELDALKVNHRNENVREKSESFIRQIKEYRRRGRLADGVPLVADISRVETIATEPDLANSLPWLDHQNNDDRFIASVIEVMRKRPHSQVVLVSRDINLQNKAEFAQIPFTEPPEPIIEPPEPN